MKRRLDPWLAVAVCLYVGNFVGWAVYFILKAVGGNHA